MSAELCPHDLLVGTCTTCMGEPEHPAQVTVASYVARYHGRCPACRRPIEPGEVITRTADGWLCCA